MGDRYTVKGRHVTLSLSSRSGSILWIIEYLRIEVDTLYSGQQTVSVYPESGRRSNILGKINYCRSGFDCKILMITNCEFFYIKLAIITLAK